MNTSTESFSALSDMANRLRGSQILGIASDIRHRIANGQAICNLTVGDFSPSQFPIPERYEELILQAYHEKMTNYPPSEGIPELRKSVQQWYAQELNLNIDSNNVLVASGARPIMYATYKTFVNPKDTVVYTVPSWNNSYYIDICDAIGIPVAGSEKHRFFPTADQLLHPLREAKLLVINSPLNPTGTMIETNQLAEIAQLVLEINTLRKSKMLSPLLWMWDQVYWQLVYGKRVHAHPVALVPEVEPYVITVDAVSKAYAATGLRVGWGVVPKNYFEAMKSLIGHIGAWAPRPEQKGTAAWLSLSEERNLHGTTFRNALLARLQKLADGFAGLGIEHFKPEGAIYLSAQFPWFGKKDSKGKTLQTNEDIRLFLLEEFGLAVVPFQAFDLVEDTGWFRCSVGAVTLEELDQLFERMYVPKE